MMERSNVYCTECGGTFIATFDMSLNGNHEITCPLCKHVHYRVVRDGVVTEDRWRSSGGPLFVVPTSTITNVSSNWLISTTPSNTSSSFITSAWLNRTDFNI